MSPRLRKFVVYAGLLEIAAGLATAVAIHDARGLAFVPGGLLLIVFGRTRWYSSRDGKEL
ncbi:MAG: hypothetical protein ABI948_01410 [Thermoleophilia bacterium]